MPREIHLGFKNVSFPRELIGQLAESTVKRVNQRWPTRNRRKTRKQLVVGRNRRNKLTIVILEVLYKNFLLSYTGTSSMSDFSQIFAEAGSTPTKDKYVRGIAVMSKRWMAIRNRYPLDFVLPWNNERCLKTLFIVFSHTTIIVFLCVYRAHILPFPSTHATSYFQAFTRLIDEVIRFDEVSRR